MSSVLNQRGGAVTEPHQADIAIALGNQHDFSKAEAALEAIFRKRPARKHTQMWAGDNDVLLLLGNEKVWAVLGFLVARYSEKALDALEKKFLKIIAALRFAEFNENSAAIDELIREMDRLSSDGFEIALGVDLPGIYSNRDVTFSVDLKDPEALAKTCYRLARISGALSDFITTHSNWDGSWSISNLDARGCTISVERTVNDIQETRTCTVFTAADG